jgi:hypothetical protein
MTLDERLFEAAAATRAVFADDPTPPLRPPKKRRRRLTATLALIAAGLLYLALGQPSSTTSRVTSAGRRSSSTSMTPASPITLPRANGSAKLIDPGPLAARTGHSVVWTGSEVVVWGGWGDETGRQRYGDGAAYNLASQHWRKIAAAPLTPRQKHVAVWTGSEMLIVGGDDHTDGAAYDPARDTWRRLPPAPFPIGAGDTVGEAHAVFQKSLYVWDFAHERLAIYAFATGRWSEAEAPSLGAAATGALHVVGARLIALGTRADQPATLVGARLSAGAHGWFTIASAPFSREGVFPDVDANWSAVAGDRVLAWSLRSPSAVLSLDVDSGTWGPTTPHLLPPCEGAAPPTPDDDGFLASSCGVTARYSTTRGWQSVDIGELAVDGRYSVWAGNRIVFWGSSCCFGTGGAPFEPAVAWSSS